ncbi:hypothetical protein MKX01_042212 [Papaver californicum]|nr:hypothetical protein MKX01_042212 [Papaver californicum]
MLTIYVMKGIVSALAASSKEFVVKDEDMESEENMMRLYERWMKYQEIYRRNGEENNRRFQVFQEHVKRFRTANCFADTFRHEQLS